MRAPVTHRYLRLQGAFFGTGTATFAAWWLFLGFDSNDYTVLQCAGLVLVLVAVGVVGTWAAARESERVAVALGGAIGISSGCFTSWMDDDTGLFLIGWMMLSLCALVAAAVVVTSTAAVKDWGRARAIDH